MLVTWEKGAIGVEWVEAREAARHPPRQRPAPYSTELSAVVEEVGPNEHT